MSFGLDGFKVEKCVCVVELFEKVGFVWVMDDFLYMFLGGE